MIKELISNPVRVLESKKTTTDSLSFWEIPPADLRLESNEVHLWLTRLDEKNTKGLLSILSDDEQAVAKQFRFDLHRRRFVTARGHLRILLSKYLLINPRRIRFNYGEFGKPFLADEWISEIKFNVSHSGNHALYAVTRCREIGVDIEQINSKFIDSSMISFCLTEQEKAYFYSLPHNGRELFFFECWTRKESFMKARGMGLALQPNEIETLSFTNFSADLANGGIGFRPSNWSLQTLPFVPGCAAALATEGNSLRLRFWQY